MTLFEGLAKEMNVEITTDDTGRYSGMCQALANITADVVLADDPRLFDMDWESQKEVIKARFYRVYPYMKYRR